MAQTFVCWKCGVRDATLVGVYLHYLTAHLHQDVGVDAHEPELLAESVRLLEDSTPLVVGLLGNRETAE